MNLLVSFQVALVTRRIAAVCACVVLPAVVYRQMSLEQRLSAEAASTVETRVAAVMVGDYVIAQSCLAVEGQIAAFKHATAPLVHGHHVTFEVVLPVGHVVTSSTSEDPLIRSSSARLMKSIWSSSSLLTPNSTTRRFPNWPVRWGSETRQLRMLGRVGATRPRMPQSLSTVIDFFAEVWSQMSMHLQVAVTVVARVVYLAGCFMSAYSG